MNGDRAGRGDIEALRQRILNAPPPVTAELLDRLRRLPDVAAARETWFHGWVQIDVDLGAWNEDTWHGAHDLIDAFARPYVGEFSVVGRVNLPEHPPAAVAARPAGEDAGACRICGHPRAEHEGDGEMVHGFVPSSPVPDQVREEIIGALAERLNPRTGMSERAVERLADAALATPALRRYLDAAAAVERVRVIHRPIDPEGYPAEGDELAYCAGDGFVWPCPTARVMAGEQP